MEKGQGIAFFTQEKVIQLLEKATGLTSQGKLDWKQEQNGHFSDSLNALEAEIDSIKIEIEDQRGWDFENGLFSIKFVLPSSHVLVWPRMRAFAGFYSIPLFLMRNKNKKKALKIGMRLADLARQQLAEKEMVGCLEDKVAFCQEANLVMN